MEDTSELFELLAADRRRQVLLLLCGTESVQVPEGLLARGQARARDSGDDRSRPSSVESPPPADGPLQRLDTELFHVHLPKLEAAGVVEWAPETGTVSRGPTFEEIEPVLRLLAANPDRFPDDLF